MSSAATIMSAVMPKVMPAPRAGPLIATMVGLVITYWMSIVPI